MPDHEPQQTPESLARDVLITRVVDGEASGGDWRTLAGMAASDQTLWAELAEAQQSHDELTRAVEIASAPAESVELSDIDAHLAPNNPMEHRLATVGKWGGWAAAACVALLWITGLDPTAGPNADTGNQAGLVSIGDTPEDAFDRYVRAGQEQGTVVREIPDRVVYAARPLETGQVEVTYLRQVLERRIVDETYRRASDEYGRTVEVPTRVRRAPPSAF
ncbi:MAG: hypothetical protein DHS20C14_15690 [Phycisphaeraceae bacterium]|nr:MAG: hypothetical protein DHS20C14_15690 [Phycisphaeraceae bacterium]